MKEKVVVKSNALIEAAYHPESRYQMRVLLACVSMIKSAEELKVGHQFELSAKVLADLTGENAKSNYRELKKAAEEIMAMSLKLKKSPTGEPLIDAKKEQPDEIEINMAAACAYYKRQGKVVLEFSHSVLPYLSELKGYFTKYKLKHIIKMKSAYGIRLYELLVQWFGDEREMSIEEFKEMFGIEDKYPRLPDLKKRVIEPALKDVNKYSNFNVEFGQRKNGRRVTHFQFKFRPKDRVEKKLTQQFIEKNAKPGMSWTQATQHAKKLLK